MSRREIVEAKVVAIERLTMELPTDVVTFELEGKDHTFVSDGIVTHNIGYKT